MEDSHIMGSESNQTNHFSKPSKLIINMQKKYEAGKSDVGSAKGQLPGSQTDRFLL